MHHGFVGQIPDILAIVKCYGIMDIFICHVSVCPTSLVLNQPHPLIMAIIYPSVADSETVEIRKL
jgi:hypothetical protein